jgi:hypothetical protein
MAKPKARARKRAQAAKLSKSARRDDPTLRPDLVNKLQALPDEAFVTEIECEALTRLSRTTLHRIEHGLDRLMQPRFEPEPLLKSVKMGPKRKARPLGNIRKFIKKRVDRSQAAAP